MPEQRKSAEKKITELNKETKEDQKPNIKEERIRKVALSYYSRPDIKKAMFQFSKDRECVPRYFEGFGKRPDSFQYESDVVELAKKGATSFHCSEELWNDPLQLSTEMKQEEIKNLRKGWDLIIDVDSKYLDYSKIYAEILVEVLQSIGINNIGVKFSGSKGFHIIVPSIAFPEQMSGMKTREMFPEWPRLICKYLNTKISEKLKNRVLDIQADENVKDEKLLEVYCLKCNNLAEKKSKVHFMCRSCKTQMQNITDAFERKRKIRCPNCQIEMNELKREEILVCNNCKLSSDKDKNNFKERVQSKHIDADLVLVSPRHLFRMPYSLHEKTSLASVVIDKEKIKDFNLRDADPMRIVPRSFIPNSEKGEATRLLRETLEHKPAEENQTYKSQITSNQSQAQKEKFKDFQLTNINPENYPPSIKKILEGIKSDGRKRALFILLSFFKSLKFTDEQIANEIITWNEKNYEPLAQSYIKGQLSWYAKQKEAKLPPNFDKHYYKDIGINPTQEEIALKNPVSYTIRKSLSRSSFNDRKNIRK